MTVFGASLGLGRAARAGAAAGVSDPHITRSDASWVFVTCATTHLQ